MRNFANEVSHEFLGDGFLSSESRLVIRIGYRVVAVPILTNNSLTDKQFWGLTNITAGTYIHHP